MVIYRFGSKALRVAPRTLTRADKLKHHRVAWRITLFVEQPVNAELIMGAFNILHVGLVWMRGEMCTYLSWITAEQAWS